jgi:hypothetical protein
MQPTNGAKRPKEGRAWFGEMEERMLKKTLQIQNMVAGLCDEEW